MKAKVPAGPPSAVAVPLLLVLAYVIAARCSGLMSISPSIVSTLWLPSGISLAALTLLGLRRWPAIALGAALNDLLVFRMVGAGIDGPHAAAALGHALGAAAEALLGAWLLRRRGAYPQMFGSLWGVFRFSAIVMAACTLGALAGVGSLGLSGLMPRPLLAGAAWTWWLGDVCSALLLFPVIASWADARGSPSEPRRAGVSAALGAALIGVCLAVFVLAPNSGADRLASCLVFPLLAIVAYRSGLRGASSAVLCTAVIALAGMMLGKGPFCGLSPVDDLMMLDGYLAFCAAIAMSLAADRSERAQADAAGVLPRNATPSVALVVGAALAVLGWSVAMELTRAEAQGRFDALARQVDARLQSRMQEYARVLRGAAALFAAAPSVDRQAWHAFVSSQDLQDELPGLRRLAYAPFLTAAGREALLRSLRSRGESDFHLVPAGAREAYAPVLFSEPLDARGRRALGYDLYAEPHRRAAMQEARDSGRITMTDRLELLPDDQGSTPPGFLIFVPVYRHGAVPATVAERRAQLIGFAFTPLETGALVPGVVQADWPEVLLQVADGPPQAQGELLYAEAPYGTGGTGGTAGAAAGTTAGASPFVPRAVELETRIFGHPLTLRVRPSPVFESSVDRLKAQLVFIAGAIVSLLLFGAVRAQTLTGERATVLARRMTRELADSEARCRLLYEASPAMLHSINRQAILVAVSDAWLARLGYARADVLGRPSTDFLTPESRDYARQTVLPAFFRDGRCKDVEYQMVCRDGSVIDVLLSAVLTPGERGGSLAFIEDVTERRRTEREAGAARARMWEMNQRLAAIVESAGVSIIATDPRGRIQSFNAEAERMLGYRAEEVLGASLPALIHVNQEVHARARALGAERGAYVPANYEALFCCAQQGGADRGEWTYARKDGSRFPVLVSSSAIRAADGSISGFISVAIDISSQRAHAELQRSALQEKETLLKEVYHRVKNNLQVVSSLFNLQMRSLPDGSARQILQQSAERVRAMALVHEKLCRSDRLQSIDIVAYVHDLCETLAAATGADERGIRIALQVEPIEIGLEASMPLGLLLNELICNSLKHAYPEGRAGTVTVRLACAGRGQGLLEVFDDGIGFSAGMLRDKPVSLGLRLVATLARQLGARFSMETRAGAYTALTFDLADAAPSAGLVAAEAAPAGARREGATLAA